MNGNKLTWLLKLTNRFIEINHFFMIKYRHKNGIWDIIKSFAQSWFDRVQLWLPFSEFSLNFAATYYSIHLQQFVIVNRHKAFDKSLVCLSKLQMNKVFGCLASSNRSREFEITEHKKYAEKPIRFVEKWNIYESNFVWLYFWSFLSRQYEMLTVQKQQES